MGKGRTSVGGMPSVCGQRVSSVCEEAMTSTQGECRVPEGAHTDRNDLKNAALAAASAALGITELPEPVSCRPPSFLPMLSTEATAAPLPKAGVQVCSREAEACSSSAGDSKSLRSRPSDVRQVRRVGGNNGNTKKGSPTKQASNLSQSQIDANWDAL